MNLSIEFISFALQIILIVYSVRVWHWRCLLSPGFYFGCVWALGTFGTTLFIESGIYQVADYDNIIELYSLCGFTALCFIYFTWKSRNKVNPNKSIKIDLLASFGIFKFLSIIVLVIALYAFISAGASWDMGKSREMMHKNVENQSVLIGYGQVIALPLCIFAGSIFGKMMQGSYQASVRKIIFLLLPAFANLFFSVYLGGRVNFVYGLIQYAIGFALTLKINETKSISKKILLMAGTALLVVSSFISLVAAQRQEHYRGNSAQYELIASKGWQYRVLYGPMEYSTSTFIGYQYRRNDAVNLEHLGYGIYTFNGFINWTLPFAGRLGLENMSIADVFDVKYNPQETYDYTRVLYYFTHSCYIPIMKDFGPVGAYFAILFLTWIANYFFIRIQNVKSIRWAISIFLYYIFLEYWLKSNYYGTLSGNLGVIFYGLLLFDLINYWIRKHNKVSYYKKLTPISNTGEII